MSEPHANVIGCPDCGTVVSLPALERGTQAICPTCRHRLERTRGRSVGLAFAFALATFILLFPANLEPLMTIRVLDIDRETHIATGLYTLWSQQWVVLVTLVATFAILLPFVRFGLLALVLGCIRFERRPPGLAALYRIALALDLWAMPDVLLAGAAVGYSRIAARLPVSVGVGAACLILAASCAMACRAALDRRTVWRWLGPTPAPPPPGEALISCLACDLVHPRALEGRGCPRCGATLHARKPATRRRTFALVIAGLALYLPANLYPMNVNIELGQRVSYRIIDGVRDLFQAGFWPLGVIIFCTSIAIPLLKLLGLGWLLWSVQRRSTRARVFKTRLYRAVDEVGRWSCIDVFTIVIFAPMIQFGGLATATAGIGGVAFIVVVAITMVASRVFDPRLLWDGDLVRSAA